MSFRGSRTSRGTYQSRDAESLQVDLNQLKKKFSIVRQDNVFLRTQLQRMQVQMRKKDKQIQNVLSIKVSSMQDSNTGGKLKGQLENLKNEMVAISKLTKQVRSLEQEVAEKDDELRLLKSSMKFTLIKELQIEAQTYFNEARRMKKVIETMESAPRGKRSQSSKGARGRRVGAADAGLRDEIKALRRENDYLRGEVGIEDKSYATLQRLRSQMATLQHELKGSLHQISDVDGKKSHQLSDMIETRKDGGSGEFDEDYGDDF